MLWVPLIKQGPPLEPSIGIPSLLQCLSSGRISQDSNDTPPPSAIIQAIQASCHFLSFKDFIVISLIVMSHSELARVFIYLFIHVI